MTETFELTKEHLLLLAKMHWEPGEESGGPSIGKRPFGNSSFTYDIIEILGWKPDGEDYTVEQEKQAHQVFDETNLALEIILQLKTFNLGTYYRKNTNYEKGPWKRKLKPYVP